MSLAREPAARKRRVGNCGHAPFHTASPGRGGCATGMLPRSPGSQRYRNPVTLEHRGVRLAGLDPAIP